MQFDNKGALTSACLLHYAQYFLSICRNVYQETHIIFELQKKLHPRFMCKKMSHEIGKALLGKIYSNIQLRKNRPSTRSRTQSLSPHRGRSVGITVRLVCDHAWPFPHIRPLAAVGEQLSTSAAEHCSDRRQLRSAATRVRSARRLQHSDAR